MQYLKTAIPFWADVFIFSWMTKLSFRFSLTLYKFVWTPFIYVDSEIHGFFLVYVSSDNAAPTLRMFSFHGIVYSKELINTIWEFTNSFKCSLSSLLAAILCTIFFRCNSLRYASIHYFYKVVLNRCLKLSSLFSINNPPQMYKTLR